MFQQVINFLYRHPKAELKKHSRFGGYLNYRKMIRSRETMKLRSFDLPPVRSYPEGLPVYFLTGKKFLYQTLFCIQSLVSHNGEQFSFVLVDDGSFDDELTSRIIKQIPGCILVTQQIINERIQKILPEKDFPHLNEKRRVYPHIKKLTDIHTLPGGPWKLVLDSDMLFWHNPVELVQWLHKPDRPLHMVDCSESYGYSAELMKELSGGDIRPLINVGAIGLNSELINWANIENWIKILEEKEGRTYYLEQALSAMIIGNQDSVILDPAQYIVNPTEHSSGILHHYVDLSKETYFKKDWRVLL